MPLRDLIKIVLALALLLGFPGIPTLLVQSVAGGPAPVEEREERVAERTAEKVPERRAARGDAAPGAAQESGLAPSLLTAESLRAPRPARDATRLALGLSTTRLRC